MSSGSPAVGTMKTTANVILIVSRLIVHSRSVTRLEVKIDRV